MPTTQVKMNQAAQQGYDPLASVSIMDQLRTAQRRHGDADEAPVHRQPAGDQAVPGARRAAGDVPGARRADGVPRRPPGVAERRRVGDGDRNADAVAAPGARQRAGGAGPAGGVRRGQGQPRALQGRPRGAAERRHGARASALDAVAGRSGGQAAGRHQGALGTRRPGGRPAARQRDQPDLAGQGPRNAQLGQQRAARARAAGVAADRAGRRQLARDRIREPARRAVAAHREERQLARVVRRDRPGSRVPARQGLGHVPRHPERAPEGQRAAAPDAGAQATTRARR